MASKVHLWYQHHRFALLDMQEEDVAQGLAIAATELLGTDGAMKWLMDTIQLCATPNIVLSSMVLYSHLFVSRALGFENVPEAR